MSRLLNGGKPSSIAYLALICLVISLSACGGGGGGSDTNGGTPSATTTSNGSSNTTSPTTPTATTLFLTNGTSSVERYTVSSAGVLTKQGAANLCSGIAVNNDAYYEPSLGLSSDGTHLYTIAYLNNQACEYAINSDGSMAQLNPPAAIADADQTTLIRNPAANNLVTYSLNSTFNQYSIGSNGQLTRVSKATVGTLTNSTAYSGVYAATYAPGGKILYAILDKISTNQPAIFTFNVGTDGTLTLSTTAPTALASSVTFSVGSGVQPRSITVKPDGTALYVLDTAGHVFQFSISTNGTITPLPTPMVSIASTGLGDLLVTPSGKSAFVTDYKSKLIWQYTVGSNGSLSTASPATISVCSEALEKLNIAVMDTALPTLYLGCANGGIGHVVVYAASDTGTLTLQKDNQLNSNVLSSVYGQINGMAIGH